MIIRNADSPELTEEIKTRWKALLPELDASSIPLFWQTTSVAALVTKFHADVLKPFNVNHAEYVFIAVLRMFYPEGATPSTLNLNLGQTTGGVTQIVRRLENDKLIKRKPNPQDKRSFLLCLTKKGEKFADTLLKAEATAQQEKLASLSSKDRQALMKSMNLMAALLSS